MKDYTDNSQIVYSVGVRAKDLAIVAKWLHSMGVVFRGKSSPISEGINALAYLIKLNYADKLDLPLTTPEVLRVLESFSLLPNQKVRNKLETLAERESIIIPSNLPFADREALLIEERKEEPTPKPKPYIPPVEELKEQGRVKRKMEEELQRKVLQEQEERREAKNKGKKKSREAVVEQNSSKLVEQSLSETPKKSSINSSYPASEEIMSDAAFLERERLKEKENALRSFLLNPPIKKKNDNV